MTKSNKKNKWKIIIWTLLALTIVALLAVRFFRGRSLPFDEETVKMGDITTYYSFSGAVEAKNRQSIISDRMMQVNEIYFEEGDQVKEGDVLIRTTQDQEFKAAIDGEITKIHIEENAQIMAGTKLMDIVDYDNLQLTVKVDEYDIDIIALGQEVSVTINAIGKDIKGKVTSISKEAVNINGVSFFTATIDLERDDSLRAGMSAEARIQGQHVTDVVTVSMKSVQFDNNNKPYVYVKGKNNRPEAKYISVGINDGSTVEVKDGLSNGDVVLIPRTNAMNGFGPRGMGSGRSTGGRS